MTPARPRRYALFDRVAVPVADLDEYVRRKVQAAKNSKDGADPDRVAYTEVGPLFVSTIFLGIDAAFIGPPLLFETMIIDPRDGSSLAQHRCETWGEAEQLHERAVARAAELAAAPRPSRCPYPTCGAVSYNPNDARHGYCDRCKRYVEDLPGAARVAS